jgi:DHA1 family tetracycline resistance protein-like MFS transporter
MVLVLLMNCHDRTDLITKDIVKDLFPEGAVTWAVNGPSVVQSVIAFFCLPMVGGFADFYGRKPALLLCSAGLAVPYICLWAFRMNEQVSWYWGFMVLNSLTGFVGGGQSVTMICFGYLADCTTPETRAAIAGIVIAVSCIGTAEAPDLYSWLWQEGTAQGQWHCLLVIMLVHVILMFCCAIVPESGEKRAATAVMNFNPLRNFRLLTQPEETESRSCLRKLLVVAFFSLHSQTRGEDKLGRLCVYAQHLRLQHYTAGQT